MSSTSGLSNSQEADSSDSSSKGYFDDSNSGDDESEEKEKDDDDDDDEMEYLAPNYLKEDSGDNMDAYAPRSP